MLIRFRDSFSRNCIWRYGPCWKTEFSSKISCLWRFFQNNFKSFFFTKFQSTVSDSQPYKLLWEKNITQQHYWLKKHQLNFEISLSSFFNGPPSFLYAHFTSNLTPLPFFCYGYKRLCESYLNFFLSDSTKYCQFLHFPSPEFLLHFDDPKFSHFLVYLHNFTYLIVLEHFFLLVFNNVSKTH